MKNVSPLLSRITIEIDHIISIVFTYQCVKLQNIYVLSFHVPIWTVRKPMLNQLFFLNLIYVIFIKYICKVCLFGIKLSVLYAMANLFVAMKGCNVPLLNYDSCIKNYAFYLSESCDKIPFIVVI